MKAILLAAAALLGLSGAASADTFGLHIGSHHFPDREYQNNTNPGLYVKLDNGFVGGFYRNTLDRTSVYAGYALEAGPFALTVGATSGYQREITVTRHDGHIYTTTMGVSNGFLTPMISPSVRLPELLGVAPRLAMVPRIGNSSTVLHLSAEAKF